MNSRNTDLLIEYALCVAGEEDDWASRELGSIHLLKYVYIGDLEYAKRNDGRTFTEARWQFYHYGPWCGDVYSRIGPVVRNAEAVVKTYSSKYDKDTERYFLRNPELLQSIEHQLPLGVVLAIKRAVHRFSNDTTKLLHYVYQTPPMLNAAPREPLNFQSAIVTNHESEEAPAPPPPEMSAKEQKRQRAQLENKRARFAERVNRIREKESAAVKREPRYDEVFFDGIEWLDSLAGRPIEPIEGEVLFDESVWHSEHRRELFDD